MKCALCIKESYSKGKKCQHFHICLRSGWERWPPPTMHQIQDNFVHFFFVLDLFFLCLHLKSMYIEMLEIHFWAQIIIQTIQNGHFKKSIVEKALKVPYSKKSLFEHHIWRLRGLHGSISSENTPIWRKLSEVWFGKWKRGRQGLYWICFIP